MILSLISMLSRDIRNSSPEVRAAKRIGLRQCAKWWLNQTAAFFMAPVIFPIFYLNRKKIYEKYTQAGFPYDLQVICVDGNFAGYYLPELKKALGTWLFFLWTYSDEGDDILDNGIVPDTYKPKIKNIFIRRYLWSAIRNPRAIYCHAMCRIAVFDRIISPVSEICKKAVEIEGFGTYNITRQLVWIIGFDPKDGYFPFIYTFYGRKYRRFFYAGMVPAYYQQKLMCYRRFESGFRRAKKNKI